MIRTKHYCIWMAALLLSMATVVEAASIGLNFVGGRSGSGGDGSGGSEGEAISASDVAGVVPQANWNNGFGSNSDAPVPLVDDSGAATGATVSWAGVPNTWTLSSSAANTGDERLMNGYLDTNNSGGLTTVTFSNIPYSSYDVYLYKDGDADSGRSGDYTVNGVTQTDLREPSNFSAGAGVFQLATTGNPGHYALFEGVTGSTLTILADESASGGGFRAPLNGIQIVPEPATGALAILGAAGLLLHACGRRRRKLG